MKVIVCGAGQVGFQIARSLSEENNSVTVIDQSSQLVRKLTDVLDVGGIVGYASHPDVLERAGAADADMLIAATYSDEVNMIACQVAHSVFSVPQKIARVRAQEYLKPQWSDMFRREHLPIDVIISPEVEVAKAVMRRLDSPTAFDTASFLDGRVRMVGARLREDCPVVNTPLRQLSELFSNLDAIVVGVDRDDKLHVPSGDDQLFPGDDIYFIAVEEHVKRTLDLFGLASTAAGRVVIVGGGNIGLSVAREIERSRTGVRAKLIERDRSRAEYAADQLERTIVLHGDGLDAEILAEANIAEAEAIMALTDDDKVNVLSCALGKQYGAHTALALSNDPGLARLSAPLMIDAFLNPRATTVSNILRHVRRGRVRALHYIRDGRAEMIESQVLATSPLAGKRIRDVDFPPGTMVGGVLSKGKVLMPSGDMIIREGDLIVIFALRESVKQVEQMFRVSIDFF